MKLVRKVKMSVTSFEIGDQISFKIPSYGKHTMTAHEVYDDGSALFIFDECVTDRPMDTTGNEDIDFWSSELCKWLNNEFLNLLPRKIRRRIINLNNPPCFPIRIPTRSEIFGKDDASENYESDGGKQLKLMKIRKNRVCSSPLDEYAWYWLLNKRRDVVSAAYFAFVGHDGDCYSYSASGTRGVRPAFVLSV